MTHYQRVWDEFVLSMAYERAVNSMARANMKQTYIDNIIRSVFDAGYRQRVKINFDELFKGKR